MLRCFLLTMLSLSVVLCTAQTGTTHHAVKSTASGAKSISDASTGKAISAAILGDHTISCAHPDCAERTDATERTDCTAAQVLKEIRTRLKFAPPSGPPAGSNIVTVEFDVDGWGAVKGIQVDCGDEPELSKAVIVALYGLPKFVAGRKDDARVIDHCIFTYAITELFLAP